MQALAKSSLARPTSKRLASALELSGLQIERTYRSVIDFWLISQKKHREVSCAGTGEFRRALRVEPEKSTRKPLSSAGRAEQRLASLTTLVHVIDGKNCQLKSL